MFRRNRGPKCVGAATEKDPACSAIPGTPRPILDIYPAELQADDSFCKTLEERRRDASRVAASSTACADRPERGQQSNDYCAASVQAMPGSKSMLDMRPSL